MSVDYSAFKVDADASDKITQDLINQFIDQVQSDLNHIQNDQIPDDEIALVKFEGGGVPESDVSTAGAANKLFKSNSAGDITMINGASITAVAT